MIEKYKCPMCGDDYPIHSEHDEAIKQKGGCMACLIEKGIECNFNNFVTLESCRFFFNGDQYIGEKKSDYEIEQYYKGNFESKKTND